MTELQELLTNVAQLEDAKPDKQVKALYSRKDTSEADAIRSEALALVQDSDSEDDNSSAYNSNLNARNPIVDSGSSNVNADNSNFGRNASYSNAVRNVVNSNHSNRGLLSAHFNNGPSSYRRPNVKRELVRYLERKAEVTGIFMKD